MALFGGLGLLPDADALLVAAGSEYAGQFGHRGFSHSLLFAVTAAAISFFVARRWSSNNPWYVAFLAFIAVGSHGLMDSMTYRTRGIPFFWPLSDARFTLPWRPIPPAPFGEHFFSRRGVDVMGVEMVYFLPLTLIALTPPLRIWRRWAHAAAAWFMKTKAEIRATLQLPAVGAPPAPVPFSLRRSAVRVVGVGVVFTLSLALAQTTLRDSRAVAWLERAHDQTLAVSLQRTPAFRHLH